MKVKELLESKSMISIWKKPDGGKLYVFQNSIGGYSYTIEYMGGPKRGKSESKHGYSYDKLKAELQSQGWNVAED